MGAGVESNWNIVDNDGSLSTITRSVVGRYASKFPRAGLRHVKWSLSVDGVRQATRWSELVQLCREWSRMQRRDHATYRCASVQFPDGVDSS